MNECEQWKLDVMCVTETHLRETITLNEDEHMYSMIGKGRSKQQKRGGGVAVLVRKDSMLVCEMMDVGDCDMSEDILAVRLENVGRVKESIYVCVCYMTREGPGARLENVRKYEIVKRFVNDHVNERILIVGDMNGHIGLLGEGMNDNGRLLREVCKEMNLEILNETIAEGKITWRSRGQKSAIDYALLNGKAREKVVSMWIDEWKEFSVNSDHNFLLVKYECVTGTRKMQERVRKKWKLKAGDWSKFRDEIGQVNLHVNDVNQVNRELVEMVHEVAERTFGCTKGRKKCVKNTWWNDDINKERQERENKSRKCRRLRAELDRGGDVGMECESAWKEYCRQQKRVKHMIRRAKVNDEKRRLDELKRKGESGGKEWYQFLLGKKREDVCVEEVIVNGEKVVGSEHVAQAVKIFWEDIGGMSEIPGVQDIELLLDRSEMDEVDREVTGYEVEQVLKKLKNGKAAGMDEIPYEMYKWGGARMVDLLVCLFNAIWTEERVPERWNESRVILLHKGGHKSKKELKNYRPIALMDTVGKIFCMLVNERLKKCIEMNGVLSEEQNGFRVDRRGEDNMYVVRELMEDCKRESKRGYFAFLDIEKAYDRVNREILCMVLNKCGVSEKIVRIIESMYVNTRAKYALGNVETEWVYSRRGVRQGCILSPLLFSLYTEKLILE